MTVAPGSLGDADLPPLRRAIALAGAAVEAGNLPFGAVLTDASGSVLLERRNSVLTDKDCTRHAETALAAEASGLFSAEALASATLYSSCEPCAMCAGAIYWAGIGRVVFAMGEQEVRRLLVERYGDDVLPLPSRTVLAAGSRAIEVVGPALEGEARVPHDGYLVRRSANAGGAGPLNQR